MSHEYPQKSPDNEDMPFWHEEVLWVWCTLCNNEVKVSDSHPVLKNPNDATLRVCNTHPPETYKHIIWELVKAYPEGNEEALAY